MRKIACFCAVVMVVLLCDVSIAPRALGQAAYGNTIVATYVNGQ